MYITIDVGGTNTRVAGTRSLEKPDPEKIVSFPTLNDYEKSLKNIVSAIKEIAKDKRILGLGVGVPGILDKKKDTLSSAPNIKKWNKKPIRNDLKNEFDCPVFLENDTALAALGEANNIKNIENFIFIIWGTGLGGTEIKFSREKIEYFPFEPGHEIIIEENGREGACGHKGDLESYVGGASIEKYYHKKPKDLSGIEWQEILNNFASGLMKILDNRPTSLVIFGGGISIDQKDKVKELEKIVAKNIKIQQPPVFRITKLGDNAALYGGLELIRLNQGR